MATQRSRWFTPPAAIGCAAIGASSPFLTAAVAHGSIFYYMSLITSAFSQFGFDPARSNGFHALFRVRACRIIAFILAAQISECSWAALPLEFVRPSKDSQSFVGVGTNRPIQLWGVNYDHDGKGRLIEDYWHDEWPRVSEDFAEIKALGANSIRIHLQLGRFLKTANEPNTENLTRLAKLIRLAEENGLYLVITGLGCYHQPAVPAWYDQLSEHDRWQAQATFWQAVAGVCKDSAAVFAYDLMNEPILPGEKPSTEWLGNPLGDKYYVQRIALDQAGRTREQIAKAWVQTLTGAIRKIDERHMTTIGVIPWAHYFPGAKPLFYSPEVGGPLDYVSVHFYPKAGKVDKALDALRVYEVGKPLVIEEMFPLECSNDELLKFIDGSKSYVDGWLSFYWGETIEQCKARNDIPGAVTAAWLEQFKAHDQARTHLSSDTKVEEINLKKLPRASHEGAAQALQ